MQKMSHLNSLYFVQEPRNGEVASTRHWTEIGRGWPIKNSLQFNLN